ncbi:hypothetical protein [Gemmatimonas sp.]|uniref:hypothetical protein n=1 Tax=Gemmatimonas sp. TaxID=1962908 RepID=UPI0037BFEE79
MKARRRRRFTATLALRERFAAVQFAGAPAEAHAGVHVLRLASAPLRPERATTGSPTTVPLP